MSVEAPKTLSEIERHLVDVLDRISLGVVIIDRHRRVIHTNRAGSAILSKNEGLEMRGCRVIASNARSAERLEGLIDAALSNRQPSPRGCAGLMSIALESGRRPLHICISRLGQPDSPEKAAVALLISDELRGQKSMELMCEIYRLTPSECRLAEQLAEGHSLSEAAAALGTSVLTARSHLKRIFEKTGARRQAQLLWLLATGLAALDLDS